VSLLIASLAFHGMRLAEAKVGILSAALCASALGWAVFRLTALLPKRLRLAGAARHRRGPSLTWRCRSTRSATTCAARTTPPVTLVEYGDYECPYCGRAEPVIRELLAGHGDLR